MSYFIFIILGIFLIWVFVSLGRKIEREILIPKIIKVLNSPRFSEAQRYGSEPDKDFKRRIRILEYFLVNEIKDLL